MAYTIDVSGLAPEAVQVVESLVRILRDKAPSGAPPVSIFELFGKAQNLRSGDDIAKQIEEEREAWGEL